MSFSDADVVHPVADAPSSRRKLLRTLWCLLVSQTSLCAAVACFLQIVFLVCVLVLIIQRQTDLRSSAAAAKEKQERWRSSIRATGRTHERQLLGRIARGEDRSSECVFCFFIFSVYLLFLFLG